MWLSKDEEEDYDDYVETHSNKETKAVRDFVSLEHYNLDQDDELIENITNNIDPEILLDTKTRQKIILKAVNSLPSKMRQVIILCEYEDYSIKQAAEKLKISEGTVKSRLFNARKILAQVLKPLHPHIC
jgi:RNA polymerase sigma-70 factor (ECF subfamily)